MRKFPFPLLAVAFLPIAFTGCQTVDKKGNDYAGYKEFYNKDGVIVLGKDSSSFEREETEIVTLPKDGTFILRRRIKPIDKNKDSLLGNTGYEYIREYADALQKRIDPNRIPFGLKNFPVYIRMERNELTKLIGDCRGSYLLAVPGIEPANGTNPNEDFTISFLMIDEKDRAVDPHHYSGTARIQGQQTWLPTNKTYIPQKGNPKFETYDCLPSETAEDDCIPKR